MLVRHEADGQAESGQAITYLWQGDRLGQRRAEALDHCLRRPRGREEAVKRHVLETGQPKFGEGRHIGHRRLPRAAEHGHHTHLAGLVVLDELGDGADAGGDLVA